MIPFNNKPESSSDFTVLIRSSISLFDIVSVVLLPDPNIFLCIPAPATDAAAVHPKGINTRVAKGVVTLLINSNPVFNKGPSNLPKNSPDCIIFDN